MTDFSVLGLARKYCRGHPQGGTTIPPCTCRMLAAAIREALEEAEKVVKDIGGPRDAKLTGMIAAAIAALKGTP